MRRGSALVRVAREVAVMGFVLAEMRWPKMPSSMQTRTHMLRFRLKACVMTTLGGGGGGAEMWGRRVEAEVKSLWEARDVEVRCAVTALNCWIRGRRLGGVVPLGLVLGWGGRLSLGGMVGFRVVKRDGFA